MAKDRKETLALDLKFKVKGDSRAHHIKESITWEYDSYMDSVSAYYTDLRKGGEDDFDLASHNPKYWTLSYTYLDDDDNLRAIDIFFKRTKNTINITPAGFCNVWDKEGDTFEECEIEILKRMPPTNKPKTDKASKILEAESELAKPVGAYIVNWAVCYRDSKLNEHEVGFAAPPTDYYDFDQFKYTDFSTGEVKKFKSCDAIKEWVNEYYKNKW